MRKTFTLFILSFILIGATPPADPENGPTIIRSFSNLYLGMSIAEMEDAYPVDEIAAGSLLPGEKMFAVYARFPEINKVLATFYLGKLFRIELFYSPDYAKRVPWERFVSVVRKGYGEGWSFDAQGGPLLSRQHRGRRAFQRPTGILPRKKIRGVTPARKPARLISRCLPILSGRTGRTARAADRASA